MSFTTEVKSEIAQNELKPCCQKAELSALVQLCSSLTINAQGMSLMIKTENAATAKRILKLLKENYAVETDLSVIKKMNLKKNNIYRLQVLNKTTEILNDLGLFTDHGLQNHPTRKLVQKECCARAYLAGAFMAMGSVNSPQKTNYHLEIVTNDEAHALFIQDVYKRQPPTLPESIYEQILAELPASSIRVVVDAEGALLRDALRFHPFLIKPNLAELHQLVANPQAPVSDQIQELRQQGALSLIHIYLRSYSESSIMEIRSLSSSTISM